MAREMTLSSQEVDALAKELADASSKLSADEVAFLNRVVEKARADVKRGGQAGNAEWEWTYRF